MTKLTDAELADLVALEILKWRPYDPNHGSDYAYVDYSKSKFGDLIPEGYFDPCNDWNDMRVVIEKLTFWRIEFIFHIGSVEVRFRTSEREGKVKAENVGRAVCLSALKAAGVDV